jgi:uncharacterized protein YdaU (DUF1376 family)
MSRPWMPLYVADYLADTGHLSTIEHGAYMLLIMHYWQNGGLPTDERRLARICRLSESDWSPIRDAMAELFDEDWRHGRIDSEIAKADEMLAKRSAAGKAGASARYGNRIADEEQTDGIARGNSQSQSHTSSLRSEVAREEYDEFVVFNETFWPAYPHKVGKPAALKAFRGARKRAKLPEIMAGLQRYIAAKPPDRPWCNPATFLNQDRWNDQPAAVAPRPNGTGPPQSMSAKLVALTDQPIEKTLNDYLAKHGDHSAAGDAEGNSGPAPPAVRTIPDAGR